MGDREMLQLLLDHGCPVDECADELTPLHMATMNGHAAVAQRLIDEEAEINKAHDDGGWTMKIRGRLPRRGSPTGAIVIRIWALLER